MVDTAAETLVASDAASEIFREEKIFINQFVVQVRICC